jgi:transcriptional regulator with XRE-family HTH domain
MNYSKAIRVVRAARGFSQQELASLAKLDPSYISYIESGNKIPTLKVVEAISLGLNIPVYLLTLLASEKEDLHGLPEKETRNSAVNLLNILIDSNKDK